jgi:hypothetical protein
MKSVSRGTLLKRRSTRHVSEVTAIASEFGNSAKIIVPRSWLERRVIAFLHSEYIEKHQIIKTYISSRATGLILSYVLHYKPDNRR